MVVDSDVGSGDQDMSPSPERPRSAESMDNATTPWQEYQYSLAMVTSHECILCGTPSGKMDIAIMVIMDHNGS